MEEVQTLVVGAGVVGLAVARRLAMAGHEVIVAERAEDIGTGVSSRNSEVIHAGIYYAKGSKKALFCVHGKHALYRYCAAHGVPYNDCGKLIVATSEAENAALEEIRLKAAANGVPDLKRLTPEEAREVEPELSCTAALLSPSTGIVDSHSLMLELRGDAEAHGAMFAFHTPLERCKVADGGLEVTTGGEMPMTLRTRNVVNCAGLGAPGVAAATEGLAGAFKPKGYFAKGNYFSLPGKPPFSRLIYPVPVDAWLGVHVTVDLGGQVKFGPDLEWIDDENYDVDPGRADVFYDSVRRYYPGLPDGGLRPDYAGIRPKLYGAGQKAVDFQTDGPARHGIPGLVNLFGIESPGLTAALAIAEHVAATLGASNRDPLRGESVEFGLD